MGDKRVASSYDEAQMRAFTLGVLNDLQALEMMLDAGLFEENVCRIGGEQEMFLVDSAMRPAAVGPDIVKAAGDRRLTTEIGRFNLEANLTPREFTGDCLGVMEAELVEILDLIRKTAAE